MLCLRSSEFGIQISELSSGKGLRALPSEFRVRSSEFTARPSEFRVQSSGPKMRRPRVALTVKGGPNVVGAELTPTCGAHTRGGPSKQQQQLHSGPLKLILVPDLSEGRDTTNTELIVCSSIALDQRPLHRMTTYGSQGDVFHMRTFLVLSSPAPLFAVLVVAD